MIRSSVAAALLLVVMTASAACGAGETGGAVLTIDQALGLENGRSARVQGMLIAKEGDYRLASVVLESYPPQAGGSQLPLEGLDLRDLAGLNSTFDQPELEQVVWSDFPLVLEGTIRDGALEVKKVPPVAEATAAGLKLRFSPASEPLAINTAVWWVFELTNTTGAALDLTFPSGQMGDVALSRDGSEVYRWSIDKSFLQAVQVVTLQSGKSTTFVLSDPLTLSPGSYQVSATVAATVGPEGSGTTPPTIETSCTVR